MRITVLAIIAFTWFSGFAQQPAFGKRSCIYLVRHAEKLSGSDPLLTSDGNKRAGDLMRNLKDKNIQRIYVTEYKRTQNTGDSLRLQFRIDTVHYPADTALMAELLKKIMMNNDLNDTILIIGHSNTIPAIIQRLGIRDYPLDEIPSNEFDNLYLVRFKKGKAYLTKTKYGADSGNSAMMQ